MNENFQSEITPHNEETGATPAPKRSSCLGFMVDTVETILLALVPFFSDQCPVCPGACGKCQHETHPSARRVFIGQPGCL